MANTWRDPTAHWSDADANSEVETIEHRDPAAIWRETTGFNPQTHPVGRLRYYFKWPGHGAKLWSRPRYWPTRRTPLLIRGEYNPKTLRREKTIVDKRPIWWLLGLALFLIWPFLMPSEQQGSLFAASSIFFIYASVNLCWMLIIGTAGIYSLASFAVVGAAGYAADISVSNWNCSGGSCRLSAVSSVSCSACSSPFRRLGSMDFTTPC